MIDGLELLAGIVIFSNSKGDEKVQYLFNFFDFNESFSLTLMDIEFMLQSVLVATSKIYNLNLEPYDLEIVQLVKKNFMEGYTVKSQ